MARFRFLSVATVALLLGSGGIAHCSIEIKDMGTSTQLTSVKWQETFKETGFVTLLQKKIFGGGETKVLVRGFGLGAGSLPLATLMQINIGAYKGRTIESAFLEFDFNLTDSTVTKAIITSFDTNGTLGFLWNPDGLGDPVVADVTSVSKNRIDVTRLLNDRLKSGKEWLGLHLTTDTGSFLFRSTLKTFSPDSGRDAAKVRLDVEVAVAHNPEPSALAIWSILGVALVAGRRRLFG